MSLICSHPNNEYALQLSLMPVTFQQSNHSLKSKLYLKYDISEIKDKSVAPKSLLSRECPPATQTQVLKCETL